MALVESVSIQLGTKMPDFFLATPDEESLSSDSLMGEKGLLVVFTCNHCPYAIAIWDRVIALANEFESKGISTVAINPNIHPGYPEDSSENMTRLIEQRGIEFPYLVDPDQSVARSYDAQCTPDLYLLNTKQELVYHGRLDDNWQRPDQVEKQDLRLAMTALVAGESLLDTQLPSMGCSIKWS
ncbi:thioredoxin family protein [bacterium]|jgi:peroxiredoxin|nr:thioredoxin family protein [bacterium]